MVSEDKVESKLRYLKRCCSASVGMWWYPRVCLARCTQEDSMDVQRTRCPVRCQCIQQHQGTRLWAPLLVTTTGGGDGWSILYCGSLYLSCTSVLKCISVCEAVSVERAESVCVCQTSGSGNAAAQIPRVRRPFSTPARMHRRPPAALYLHGSRHHSYLAVNKPGRVGSISRWLENVHLWPGDVGVAQERLR